MEQLRKQLIDVCEQLRFISDQMLELQLQKQEETKVEQKTYPVQEFVVPQTESWDDDDEPSFIPSSGYTGLAAKRIIRRSASKCPACGKIGGCNH